MSDDPGRKLARELQRILDGLTPIEKALMLAEGLREAYGGDWVIEAKANGDFNINGPGSSS
jgi:hypothetical protein